MRGRPHYRLAYTDGRATWATDWVGVANDIQPGAARFGPLADALAAR